MDIDELPCYYTSDEIRMAMRFYTLGCVIHERSLMLLEASNADDRWLADVCRHEFHSQERVDMSLTMSTHSVLGLVDTELLRSVFIRLLRLVA